MLLVLYISHRFRMLSYYDCMPRLNKGRPKSQKFLCFCSYSSLLQASLFSQANFAVFTACYAFIHLLSLRQNNIFHIFIISCVKCIVEVLLYHTPVLPLEVPVNDTTVLPLGYILHVTENEYMKKILTRSKNSTGSSKLGLRATFLMTFERTT